MYVLSRDQLSAIATDGAFGENIDFVSFETNTNLQPQDQCMSTVQFGTITTSQKSSHHVLIKLKLRDKKSREVYRIDSQFHNEITMYKVIIPFLLSHRSQIKYDGNIFCNVPSLPRFIYGQNKCGEYVEDDLIILENVSPLGYRLCEERIFLDYGHLISAIQALAKFHALSYSAKHEDPAGFRNTITDVRDTQFHPDVFWLFSGDKLLKYCKRGVDRLLKRSGDLYRDHEHVRRLNELIGKTENSIRQTLRPREPFSVVCHGDFNRNNVLFRYDDAGNPVDALLFDFGTPRYGSPALDLSFFLYMNTTQTMRHCRWHELLDAYCTTVKASVPSDVRVPDRAELDTEMAACALFGFAHVMFFLPYQMCGGKDEDEASEIDTGDDNNGGGDTRTEIVADVVQHFVDMGYTNV